tara:strand:- start:294 stop:761 length:468 start_codon:yes stop_codon:yes gene_type:complete
MDDWFTGSGNRIAFNDILEIITKHSEQDGTVYIGSDSMLQKQKCVFCTAICLLGDTKQSNRYFIRRTKSDAKEFKTLLQRITSEVQKSIDMGLRLLELCPTIKIELHLDVSNSNKESRTGKFADMLVGYAKGSGFDCKIKPDAFAAYCVADKHSK